MNIMYIIRQATLKNPFPNPIVVGSPKSRVVGNNNNNNNNNSNNNSNNRNKGWEALEGTALANLVVEGAVVVVVVRTMAKRSMLSLRTTLSSSKIANAL